MYKSGSWQPPPQQSGRRARRTGTRRPRLPPAVFCETAPPLQCARRNCELRIRACDDVRQTHTEGHATRERVCSNTPRAGRRSQANAKVPHLLLGNQVALKTAAPQPTGSENGVRLDVEVTHFASHVVILSQNLPDFEIFSTERGPSGSCSQFIWGKTVCVVHVCACVCKCICKCMCVYP